MSKLVLSIGAHEKDIDLKKKRRAVKKSIYSVGDDWASKFCGTSYYADALQVQRQKVELDHLSDALSYKYGYDKLQTMSPITRAKAQAKRELDQKRLDQKRRDLEQQVHALELKRIDERIRSERASAKQRKAEVATPVGKGLSAILRPLKKLSSLADPQSPQKLARPDRYSTLKMRKQGQRSGFSYSTVKGEEPEVEKGLSFSDGEQPQAKAAHGTYAIKLQKQHHYLSYTPTKGYSRVLGRYPSYAKAKKTAEVHSQNVQARQGVQKSDNSPDIDIDAGRAGVADYGEGQVAMRVAPNQKCSGCTHYDNNLSTCQKGMIPVVCGDGTYPEIGYAPVAGNRIAAKNWMQLHADAVVTSVQAPDQGYTAGEVPFRVDVLGHSTLSLAERMTLLKGLTPEKARKILHDKEVHGKPLTDRQRRYFGAAAHGAARKSATESDAAALSAVLDFSVLPPRDEQGGPTSRLESFADAMGTTVDVVRSIASRLGDRQEFLKFMKAKLPDIMQTQGLDEAGVGRLFTAATKSVKSLSAMEWELWKGLDFGTDVEDGTLARAIAERGLLDPQTLYRDSIVTPAAPVAALAAPEPLQPTQQVPVAGFVGGNLHLADSFSHRR